ncbi:MAG: HAMP domain-containing histidine kinase, partial [Deltaproteobacteria bacterium]|nr:HAMP domain-containing histidine kinase [Deltaproteobacteria bacterium]
NTERVERMVNETLDIEKIESGRTDFQLSSFAVGTAVSEVVRELAPLIHSRSLQLQTDIAADLPPVRGDRDRIKDVVTNLLINAFDYSPEGGILRIICAAAVRGVRIGVWDQGPGVPPELREKVFEKFYKGRKGGTGLGLALCRSVVNAHHGRIWVENADIGGSAFIIELPADEMDPDTGRNITV